MKWESSCNSHATYSTINIVIIINHTSSTHTHNRFTVFFPGPTGWDGARGKHHLDFMVQRKITEVDTPTIRVGATPSGLISNLPPSSHIFTLDALLGATLALHPGLGQVPNMLACIPSILPLVIYWYMMLVLSVNVNTAMPFHTKYSDGQRNNEAKPLDWVNAWCFIQSFVMLVRWHEEHPAHQSNLCHRPKPSLPEQLEKENFKELANPTLPQNCD